MKDFIEKKGKEVVRSFNKIFNRGFYFFKQVLANFD